MKRTFASAALALGLLLAATPARAGIPVIDVAALAQLMQQVAHWTQQIQHMTTQIRQLQQTYDSISGQRGLERLLPITPAARNYLPEEIGPMLEAIGPVAGAYAGVAGQVRTLVEANTVLQGEAFESLTAEQRTLIENARRAAAGLQRMSGVAYGQASRRFAQLQQLLAAIAATDDQKSVLELSARIQSEQTMLATEHTKLTMLYQLAQAQALARAQQMREHSVRSTGSFKSLPARAY
jgi:type IV secretion system protein VirB5